MSRAFNEDETIGSPLKKQRASLDANLQDRSANFPSALGDVLGRATAAAAAAAAADARPKQESPLPAHNEDEEL